MRVFVGAGKPLGPRELIAATLIIAASLDQASKIVVVAGGSWKVRGLAKLLAHWRPDGRRFMNTLITDVTTAQKLLDLP